MGNIFYIRYVHRIANFAERCSQLGVYPFSGFIIIRDGRTNKKKKENKLKIVLLKEEEEEVIIAIENMRLHYCNSNINKK